MYMTMYADLFLLPGPKEATAIKKPVVEIRRSITTLTDTPNPVGSLQVVVGQDFPAQVVYVSPIRDLIKTTSGFVSAVAEALPIDLNHDAHIDKIIKEKSREQTISRLDRQI